MVTLRLLYISLLVTSDAALRGTAGPASKSITESGGRVGDDASTVLLNNGKKFPLVGLGVGNLPHELIPQTVQDTVLRDDEAALGGVRVIDTAMASRNERLVADAVTHAVTPGTKAVEIVTKVWYTHLGYERTVRAVMQSLHEIFDRRDQHHARLPLSSEIVSEAREGLFDPVEPYLSTAQSSSLPASPIRVTILLHWPRCRSDISWMHCEDEENAMPQEIRALDGGAPPHLRPDEAWMDSWRALEDLYGDGSGPIANIGVSNFDAQEMQRLLRSPSLRQAPQLLQGNIWSAMFDPDLMRLLRAHRVVFQAYNVMNGVFSEGQGRRAPEAMRALAHVGAELAVGGSFSAAVRDGERSGDAAIVPSAVVLRWLMQEGVCTIPRAARPEHLAANTPLALATVPELSRAQALRVAEAVRALLRGDDGLMTATGREQEEEQEQEQEQERRRQEEPGDAPARVVATFVNHLHERESGARAEDQSRKEDEDEGEGEEVHAQVFWVHSETGDQIPATGVLRPGDSASLHTHRGHRFVVRQVTKPNFAAADSEEQPSKSKNAIALKGGGVFEVTTTTGRQDFHIQAEL